MSNVLNNLTWFKRSSESFSDGHGITTDESRVWEKAYRGRWSHDKVVRSTHGVNCTGSCSWKIYVKGGLVTWETQYTDYPRTRPELPNHEPRGCSRGASYSWYLYSASRLKFPMIRKALLRQWRDAKKVHDDPVEAWGSIVEGDNRTHYKKRRGLGGMVRASWDEVNQIIAASNIYTAKQFGPDRIIGFSPIPAMSMVSYAAGSRYLSLIGGTCMSFYDWYCDLPPSSPQTWGEQTDVPESADWYNSGYIIAWGSNVPQTRTPDAHFFTEVRYKGTKTVAVTPDYSEVAKLSDEWLAVRQGTDAALAMAMGHVVLTNYHAKGKSEYFDDYCRRYSDMPFLVQLDEHESGNLVAGRTIRASDFKDQLGHKENSEWKPVLVNEKDGKCIVPNGTIGSRWDKSKTWNLDLKGKKKADDIVPTLSFLEKNDEVVEVGFPYFGNQVNDQPIFQHTDHDSILVQNVPIRTIETKDGPVKVATVFDLMLANYGVDRGLGGNVATSFDDDAPYTPRWQEQITGIDRQQVIRIANEFAENADKTHGRSMVILGAAINHWYNMDMNYRGIINLLIMCGCIGQSGGGWAHYVGQEKLRPQTGWLPLAFGLDWTRPPRQMNSTSFFYNHSNQWRYESLNVKEILSPLSNPKDWDNTTFIDCNVRSERMGWLPSAPQLNQNPLKVGATISDSGENPGDYMANALKSEEISFAAEDPDSPQNFPRVLFVWRSNILGSSGKGHEYMLKHLLGTQNGVLGEDIGVTQSSPLPSEVKWHDNAPEGKLDLVVTLDFRMSTTAVYSDIVLPSATWYEKNDLNTSDMHPFIHPLTKAVDPAWESRSDWDIYKGFAKEFSNLCPEHLGIEHDAVTIPILHDTPGEIAQPFEISDWKKAGDKPVPGKNMPNIALVERNYPETYQRFISLGPLLEKMGNGGKGISWNTDDEVALLRRLNGERDSRAKIESDIDATEVILTLAPETNGQVAVKAWEALGNITGKDHRHLALPKEEEKIRFRDIISQPRKIISSPTWSGLESEHVSYNAGYTNVHELIPWRTLTGRQQFYQDHQWMRDFGEGFCVYKPPINTRTVEMLQSDDSTKEVVLNWITPHQKWGIHSTYSDNLLMLTLSRGGPVVWMSEIDARKIGVEDNAWLEIFNVNGAITCRAIVSQRIPEGVCFMYHAQEKTVNTPTSPMTGGRGGIHNSVTRAVLKPTHMIGGYAQLSWGFNYYGTVGSNRDEFVIVRPLTELNWMDDQNDIDQLEATS